MGQTCKVTVISKAVCVGAPANVGTLSGVTKKPAFSMALVSIAKLTGRQPVLMALNLRTCTSQHTA